MRLTEWGVFREQSVREQINFAFKVNLKVMDDLRERIVYFHNSSQN